MSTSQDFRVGISVIEPTPPAPSRGGKIIFVGLPLTPTDLAVKTITSEADISLNIDPTDANEIVWTENDFVFCPYTDLSDLQTQIDLTDGQAKTIIISSAATNLASYDLNFNGVVVYTVDSATPWDNAAIQAAANKEDTCVFIDPEKEGKPYFTFSNAISTFEEVGGFIGQKNTDFSSVFKTVAIQKLMVDNSFSFYFQATETPTTECNDVYIGAKQAQVFYQYLAIEEETKTVVYNFVAKNYPYTDDSLAILDSQISRSLSALVNKDIIGAYETTVPLTANQSVTNKTKGWISGYRIAFDELYRIARVEITIEGRL